MFFKIKRIFILLLIMGIIFPIFSFAAISVQPGTVAEPGVKLPSGANITKPEQLFKILADVLGYVYKTFFVVAVLFIILTAYTYLTAQDDAEKIKNAHKQLIWASIAIAVALMSLSFNVIINNFIQPSGGSSGKAGGTGGSPGSESSGLYKNSQGHWFGPGGGAINIPQIPKQ